MEKLGLLCQTVPSPQGLLAQSLEDFVLFNQRPHPQEVD